MALARVTTWNSGDTLKAADLNGEFNNLLNNPISLVSPTTGAINFQTSVTHTNLQVASLTASSGFAGSVLVTSTAGTPVPMWSTGAVTGGVFVATTASIPTWLALGTSGQLLTVTSSGNVGWLGGASNSYTPVWTGVTSQPSGGNGRFMQLGKFVWVSVAGWGAVPSNSTTLTVTLPVVSLNAVAPAGWARITDNSANQTVIGRIDTRAASSVADLFKDLALGAFSTGGTKIADFVLTYEAQ